VTSAAPDHTPTWIVSRCGRLLEVGAIRRAEQLPNASPGVWAIADVAGRVGVGVSTLHG